MSTSSPVVAAKPGDIVVGRVNDGSRRYTVGTPGGGPQIIYATHEEATARVDRFARTHHVDVWQTEDGRTFTRILEARLASSG
jgi:hypothetical protein